MLTSEDKYLARIIFRNRLLESDGNSFEHLFTTIMNYAEPEFKQIKPWGKIGDRKNDGYIKTKGIYYQVYAPEDLRSNYPDMVKKLKDDFSGLLANWSQINEFYFLVNDKFKGVNAEAEKIMNQLITNNNLSKGGIITASFLEEKLFSLSDDQIKVVIGIIPDPSKIKLEYNTLNEVISHIMELSLEQAHVSEILMPDWDEKIKFNQLSSATAHLLNNGYFQINNLQKYLDNNSQFLADDLRDKMNEIYIYEKSKHTGDELFWAIVNKASPKNISSYQSAVIVIMAKYFEACDIFERPDGVENDTSH